MGRLGGKFDERKIKQKREKTRIKWCMMNKQA
jgi:hypothetical protein